MNCSTPGFPVLTISPEFAQNFVQQVNDAMMPSNHLTLCCLLLLLPSIFSNIRVFFSVLVLCIRWPKCWSISFSISPSNEYSGLISFRMDWLDLFAVYGTLKSLPAPQFENINSSELNLLYSPTFTSVCDYWKKLLYSPILTTVWTFVG